MRITGGKYLNRIIRPPAGFKARPTTDLARESLMNILNNRYDFESVSLLDLFGGTGAISYEFASRGTVEIDIVETDRRSCRFISNTLKELGLERARVHRLDVRDWLKICRRQYDIIFADPPYDLPWLSEIPDRVMASGAVHDSTLLILEHSAAQNFGDHPGFAGHRRYGLVNYTFFRKKQPGTPVQ